MLSIITIYPKISLKSGHHYRKVEWFTVDQFIERIENYKEYAEKMGEPYILN